MHLNRLKRNIHGSMALSLTQKVFTKRLKQTADVELLKMPANDQPEKDFLPTILTSLQHCTVALS